MSRYSLFWILLMLLGSMFSLQSCQVCDHNKGETGDLAHCDGSLLKDPDDSDSSGDFDLNGENIDRPTDITISNFKIFTTEVTNEQYATFLREKGAKADDSGDGGTNDCHPDEGKTALCYRFTGPGTSVTIGDDTIAGGKSKIEGTYTVKPSTAGAEPATYVSWYGAKAFCEAIKWSLPTEAQWEEAAGSGTYPWGDDDPSCNHANFVTDDDVYCNGDVIKVEHPSEDIDFANGLVHMAGNVYEWTAEIVEDDNKDEIAENRIMKGGAWDSGSDTLKISSRKEVLPTVDEANIGFRCATGA